MSCNNIHIELSTQDFPLDCLTSYICVLGSKSTLSLDDLLRYGNLRKNAILSLNELAKWVSLLN